MNTEIPAVNQSDDVTLDLRPRLVWGTILTLFAAGFACFAAGVFAYAACGGQLVDRVGKACAQTALHDAQQFEKEGNLDRAEVFYRQALRGGFPHEDERHLCGRSLGELLYRQQRYDEAAELYRSLPEAAFAEAGAYSAYVNALWRQGAHSEADSIGQTWLAKAHAAGDTNQLLWAYYTLGRVAEDRGALDAALEQYRAAAALDPANDAALRAARILRQQGRGEKAKEILDTLIAHAPPGELRSAATAFREKLKP